MEGISTSVIRSILKSEVKKVIPYHKYWIIATNDQKWVVKKTHKRINLLWITKINQELRNRGFTSLPTIKTDGKELILVSYIEGESGDYTNLKHVSSMMEALGDFHLSAQGLFAPSNKRRDFLFYHRLYKRLVQYYRLMIEVAHIPGELGTILQAHGRDFYFDGLLAWEKLQRSTLKGMTDRDRQLGNIAHRDLASHNWIIDTNGKPCLIDWDTSDYDLQLGDVWQMSTRVLCANGWSDECMNVVLSSYEKKRSLSSLELNILFLLFSFPNEFYRETIGLARKKPGYKEKNVIPYLNKIINNRSNWRRQIKNCFSNIHMLG